MSAAEAKFRPGPDVNVPHNVTRPEFVYYRIYHEDVALATSRPAYLDDIYIGRIRSKWVTPPHTAGSLKLCLCSMENIDPKVTKIFASVSNQSALADGTPISLKCNQTLGIIPKDPVILFSKAMPEAVMQPGTESFRVAPDSKSPLAPQFLFYGVYTEAGAQASRDPIDAEQPWVSKIDLNSILYPVSVTSLLHILNMKEGINISSQLLAQDGGPLGDDQMFTKDGDWLGASAEDHLVLKLARRPPFDNFAEGSQYRIQNRCTGNSLSVLSGPKVGIVSDDAGWPREWTNFSLTLHDNGRVAFHNVHHKKWIGPKGWTSPVGTHGFWLIPSTTNKNYFLLSPRFAHSFLCTSDYEGSICEGGPVFCKAFYDKACVTYDLELRELDTTDSRQMWTFVPRFMTGTEE